MDSGFPHQSAARGTRHHRLRSKTLLPGSTRCCLDVSADAIQQTPHNKKKTTHSSSSASTSSVPSVPLCPSVLRVARESPKSATLHCHWELTSTFRAARSRCTNLPASKCAMPSAISMAHVRFQKVWYLGMACTRRASGGINGVSKAFTRRARTLHYKPTQR